MRAGMWVWIQQGIVELWWIRIMCVVVFLGFKDIGSTEEMINCWPGRWPGDLQKHYEPRGRLFVSGPPVGHGLLDRPLGQEF